MTDVVEQLTELWSDVLGGAAPEAGQDFFEAGGDSILAMNLMLRVEEHFAVFLDPGVIFEAPTLGALASKIREQMPQETA